MEPRALDHVALWVDARDELAAFLYDTCGMHEIERTEAFTLVGGDAQRGKLTLFDADGPREAGVVERIVLRMPRLPRSSAEAERDADGLITMRAPAGVPLGLLEETTAEVVDLDHIVLRVPDPPATARSFATLGLELRDGRLWVADKYLVLRESNGSATETERPLLNHLGLLVDSVSDTQRAATARGVVVDRVVDAPNTIALFVQGPAGMAVEYVEHKPTFALV